MYDIFSLRVVINSIYFKNVMNKFHGGQTQNRGLYQIVGETPSKNDWTTLFGREIWGCEIESHVTVVRTTVTVM
jgi:hypothetical protein